MSLEEIKEKIVPIARDYGVGKLALFGSVAAGVATPESDVDILIDRITKKGFFILGALENELSQALGRRIDLSTYGGLERSLFKESILAKEVVIYERHG